MVLLVLNGGALLLVMKYAGCLVEHVLGRLNKAGSFMF